MRYRMDDGTIVDTERAASCWRNATDHDGHNNISRATGSQWLQETLYRSRRDRYYVERTSSQEGSRDYVEWVSPQEATRWLTLNDHEIPEDLAGYVDDVTE